MISSVYSRSIVLFFVAAATPGQATEAKGPMLAAADTHTKAVDKGHGRPASKAEGKAPAKSMEPKHKADEKKTLEKKAEERKADETNPEVQANHWGYVFQDSVGGNAEYQVPSAKYKKTGIGVAVAFVTNSSKTTGDNSTSSEDATLTLFGAVAVKPIGRKLLVGGQVLIQSVSGKYSVTTSDSDPISGSFSSSSNEGDAFATGHLTKLVDVGLTVKYHMDSDKSSSSTVSYNYLTFTPGFGVHDDKFEASLGYTPGTKTKGTSSSSSSDSSESSSDSSSEKETSSKLDATGRYLVTPSVFVGGGFNSSTATNDKSTGFLGEVGYLMQNFQMAGGVTLTSTTSTSATSGKSDSGSKTAFMVQGVMVDAQKQPKFSAAFDYTSSSSKADSSTTTGSLIGFLGSAYLFF